MCDGPADASREGGGDDRAVALGGVALEAQEGHAAGERSGEPIEQRILGSQILAEIGEVALEIPVLAQSMAHAARCPEGTLVLVVDADPRECLRERSLREALAARERQLPHIEQEGDACGLQGGEEGLKARSFVADRGEA